MEETNEIEEAVETSKERNIRFIKKAGIVAGSVIGVMLFARLMTNTGISDEDDDFTDEEFMTEESNDSTETE